MNANVTKTAAIYTLGCRVNQYESNALCAELIKAGFEMCDFSDVCDIYIINTCTVTAEADRKARQAIRRGLKANPNGHVIVCGCYAQTQPKEVARCGNISYICGTRNKLSIVEKALEIVNGENIHEINVPDNCTRTFEGLSDPQTGRTRAFIKIQDGCDNRCTYCIIPYARGPVCSRLSDDIADEAKRLAMRGFTEIVCTGIETSAYGRDTGEKLADVLKKISEIDGIKRIRLGSLDPSFLRPDTARELFSVEKLMPHVHLSVQSGSDKILSLMRRPYNNVILRRNMDALLEIRPNIKFSADFIVGFPNESEEDFEQSLKILSDYPFVHAHVFSYSKRSGTPAAEMNGQIDENVKANRSARFIKEDREKLTRYAEKAVKEQKKAMVLFESCDGDMIYGHTEDFYEVGVPRCDAKSGEYKKVILSGFDGEKFVGRVISEDEK